jgi:hypothetical protein
VRLVAGFVFGLAFLLSIISGIVAAFHALDLTSSKSAFGLPEGSIRAIIALVLILIFVVMAVYLVEAVFLETSASTEAQNAATQILATVGTLVAAVAAFYFGTAAVTAGTKAATAAVVNTRESAGPSAITKGSKAVEGGYELVGVINPRGLETQYFFEYGPDPTYGTKTALASAGAANAESEVSSGTLPVQKDWHLRVVAFNESGASYGADAKVTDDPFSTADVAEVEAKTTDESETETGGSDPETINDSETETGASDTETINDSETEAGASEAPDTKPED